MGLRGSETEQAGNLGETAVKAAFEELQWHVAPNPAGEVGTDLWLQARDDRRMDLGAIVGAQVKSGRSFFTSPEYDEAGELVGWWYRDSDAEHIRYWQTHTVPHILVLHDPTTEQLHWVHVTEDKVRSTGKGAKILVSKSSVVDAHHANELLKVATGGRVSARWEGSAWDGGSSVLPPDQLRYALLTPRLIAPHPNQTIKDLRADQAVALLIKMRLDDLRPDSFDGKSAAPNIEDCRSSQEWQCQLYAALHDVLTSAKGSSGLEALIDTVATPHEHAAAAAVVCAMRVEAHDPRGALAIIERALESDDDFAPVDHDWLVLHKARCLNELGDLEQARDLAVKVQRLRELVPDDPTAMAIAGAGADLIFTASEWGSNLAEVITGRDTIASWWRSQEIASGLQDHFEDHFTAWAKTTTPTADGSSGTRLRLRTASLLAGMAADHSSWRHTSSLLARHTLTFSAGDGTREDIVAALAALRRAGDNKSLKLATDRLLRSGPAIAVREAAELVRLREWHQDVHTLGPGIHLRRSRCSANCKCRCERALAPVEAG